MMWALVEHFVLVLLLLTDGSRDGYKSRRGGVNGQFIKENITNRWHELCPYSGRCTDQDSGSRPFLPYGRIPCCSSCTCDEDCLVYGTCCPDSPFFIQQQQSSHSLKCVDTYMKTTKKYSFPVLMVSVCEDSPAKTPDTDPSVISKCQSPRREILEENIPVSSQNSPYVYRNVYCALCNGETNITDWTITVWNAVNPLSSDHRYIARDVASTYLQAIDYNNTDINIIFKQPLRFQPSKCFLTSVNRCNVTGLWDGSDPSLVDACAADYSEYVTSASVKTGFSYGNVFCALCNGVEVEAYCPRGSSVPAVPPGFLALLNYQENARPRVAVNNDAVSNVRDCAEGTVYDPYKGDCRPWFCPKGFVLDEGRCQSVWENLYGFTCFLLIKATPLTDNTGNLAMSLNFLIDIATAVNTDMVDCMDDEVSDLDLSLGQISAPFRADPRLVPYYVFLFVYRVFDFQPSIYVMKSLLNCVENANSFELGNKTVFRFGHADNIAVHPATVAHKKYFPAGVPLLDEEQHILFDHYIRDSPPVAAIRDFRASRFLFCLQIVLETDEYEFYGNRLFLPKLQLTLYQDVYSKDDNGRVRICLDDYLKESNRTAINEEQKSTINIASKALFVAYAIVACLCLVVALIALLWVSRIRTSLRIACIVFIGHLLLAQILTITSQNVDSPENQGLCGGLGVASHVTWLATASLNTMFGSPLFLSQSSEYLESSRMARVRMVVFDSLLCYLPSIALPAILVGLSLYLSGGQDFGYGKHYCLIDSTQMFGYFFFLPLVGLSLLVSGITCCVSRITSKSPAVATEPDSTTFVWPAVPLALILDLAVCGWLLVYLLEDLNYGHLFWISDCTLCAFVLYWFVVKPTVEATQGRSES